MLKIIKITTCDLDIYNCSLRKLNSHVIHGRPKFDTTALSYAFESKLFFIKNNHRYALIKILDTKEGEILKELIEENWNIKYHLVFYKFTSSTIGYFAYTVS